MIPARVPAVLLAVVLAGWGFGNNAGAQDSGSAGEILPLSFDHAPWTAAVYGHEATGRLGWLLGPDGSLRLELGRSAGEVSVEQLLARSGEGWTLILGPDDVGTVNGWGREWRTVESGLGQLARAAVSFLSEEASGPSRRRIQVPDLFPDEDGQALRNDFRRDLVRRGRGRGGMGEIVVLDRKEGGSSGPWEFEIRSTRRPGQIRLGRPESLELECPVPEVFVPLWPLSELAPQSIEKPGTSSAGEG